MVPSASRASPHQPAAISRHISFLAASRLPFSCALFYNAHLQPRERSNHPMEPTTGRRRPQFPMTSTHIPPPRALLPVAAHLVLVRCPHSSHFTHDCSVRQYCVSPAAYANRVGSLSELVDATRRRVDRRRLHRSESRVQHHDAKSGSHIISDCSSCRSPACLASCPALGALKGTSLL